jgi:hypothetical protein
MFVAVSIVKLLLLEICVCSKMKVVFNFVKVFFVC